MKYLASFVLVLLNLHLAFGSDSLRTEVVNGKQAIVHRVEQGQTLYAISRKYGVSVNDIKALNPALVQLKTGAEIYIPAKQPINGTQTPTQSNNPPASPQKEDQRGTDEDASQTTHIVKQGETLYKISRIYNVPVSTITKLNNLEKGELKVGQELQISESATLPSSTNVQSPSLPPTPSTSNSIITKSEKRASATGYPSINESGLALLDESIPSGDFYSVQHKNAPVGTLVFIKCKENGNTAHAKVTSPLPTGKNALIAINKKIYDKLGSATASFEVEISYTPEQ